MRKLTIAICIIATSISNVVAQEIQPTTQRSLAVEEKLRFFLCPRENILPVIAFQPDSPIEFLKAEYYYGLTSSGFDRYKIRNRSAKTIKSFKIATVTSAGTGSSEYYKADWGAGRMLPGEEAPRERNASYPSQMEIVPFTEQLRESKKLQGMEGVVIFMVVRVEFEDGTTYSDEKTYNSLKEFFEENGIFPK